MAAGFPAKARCCLLDISGGIIEPRGVKSSAGVLKYVGTMS